MKLDEYMKINEEKKGFDKAKLSGKSFNLKKEYADSEEMPDMNLLKKEPGDFFEGDLEGEEFKNLMKELVDWKPEEFDEDDTEEVSGE